MLPFKGVYKTRLCTGFWLNSDSLSPDSKHPGEELDDLIAAYYRKVLGDDETVDIEACRGWSSWGF